MWLWSWRGFGVAFLACLALSALWICLKIHFGVNRLALLEAVDALGSDAYGLRIQQWIRKRYGVSPSLGWMYGELQGLVDAGELITWTGDPTPERGGRAKRYYARKGE